MENQKKLENLEGLKLLKVVSSINELKLFLELEALETPIDIIENYKKVFDFALKKVGELSNQRVLEQVLPKEV